MINGDPKNRIVGIFDWNEPGRLGSLLLHLTELSIKSDLTGSFDLIVTNAAVKKQNEFPGTLIQFNENDAGASGLGPVFKVIFDFKKIRNVYVCESIHTLDLNDFIKINGQSEFWPEPESFLKNNHSYDSFRNLNTLFHETAVTPRLEMKSETSKNAREFLERHAKGNCRIVVHLKNNGEKQNISNADFNEWISFFDESYNQYPNLCFCLIGNELPSLSFPPNTILTNMLGSDLATDLAMIPIAQAFMGMSSGPCQMAILNEVPYLIFKNSGHHPEKMQDEMGQMNRFLFANNHQHFFREHETKKAMMKFIKNIAEDFTDSIR